MPLYEFECTKCGHRFERLQRFSDPPPEACPTCGAAVHQLLSAPAIQFKGSGWYVTDYATKKSGSDSAPAEKSDSKGTSKESASKESASKESASKDSAAKDSKEKKPAKNKD